MYQDVQGGGCLSWFDIIKKPLISIPKGSVRIKKPKKIETKEECLPKIKKWLGDVSRIIANEPDFKITFAKSSGVCEVEEFNIPEEFACRMLEAMSDKTTKGFTALTSPNATRLLTARFVARVCACALTLCSVPPMPPRRCAFSDAKHAPSPSALRPVRGSLAL